MPKRYPIQYELTPRAVNPGKLRWVTLTLKNIGDDPLESLSVNLSSLDTYCIMVLGKGAFIQALGPGETESQPFQISAQGTGAVYVALDGQKDDKPFHWESPDLTITVGGQPAEIVSFVALAAPRARLGEPLTFEARVRGLIKSDNLVIEFWVKTPDGNFLSLTKEGLGVVETGEQVEPSIEFTPQEEGLYTIHAYLYQGSRRIDHRAEHLSIALRG